MKRSSLLTFPDLSRITFRKIVLALGISLLVAIATLYSAPFGLQTITLKFGVTQNTHAMLNQLNNEIRESRHVSIGNGTIGSFAQTAEDCPQQGNALRIYSGADTNNFVMYYVDAGDHSLKRTLNGSGHIEILADAISNERVFFGEDYRGNTLNGTQKARIIRTTLELPNAQPSLGRTAKSRSVAQFQTRVAPRLLN